MIHPLLQSVGALLLISLAAYAQVDPLTEVDGMVPVVERGPDIRVEMQIVALPVHVALPLIRDLLDEGKAKEAYGQVQSLLNAGTAKLIGWPILTTQHHYRGSVQAVDEVRYATEFKAPEVSFTPSYNPGKEHKVIPRVDMAVFNAVPSSFETRNAGVTLEADAIVLQDGNSFELTVNSEHVWLREYKKLTIENKSGGGSVVVEQPRFQVNKSNSVVTLRSGEPHLLGIFPSSPHAEHLELFLLKAELRRGK
jgi:hypothetical protein